MRWISGDVELIPLFRELCDYNPTEKAQVIFEFEDGMPVAAALYDHYTGKTIHTHAWIAKNKRPSRVFWWVIHDYTFNQLMAKQAVAMIDASNRKSVHLATSMGYKFVARIPDYYPNGDAVIFVGTEDSARHWQRYRNGAPPPTYGESSFERA